MRTFILQRRMHIDLSFAEACTAEKTQKQRHNSLFFWREFVETKAVGEFLAFTLKSKY